MANTCFTVYKCVGKREQLDELAEALHKIIDLGMSVVENKWGKTWLGWLVSALYGNADAYTLRGKICDYNYDGEVLTITQETEWEEQRGLRIFLKERFPKIDIYYKDEEPGTEVFVTNDAEGRFFPFRYLLEANDDMLYFHSLEEAAKAVTEIVGHKVAAEEEKIDDALDDYMEEHEEDFFSFHHFEDGDTSLLGDCWGSCPSLEYRH